jgi:predicted dehydrogenase
MTTPPLRVAVLGAGYFSQFHYRAWHRMEDAVMVGVCDQQADRAAATADQYGVDGRFTALEDMLETTRPDVLDIVTPPSTHLSAIEAAAKRGINVICQKPFCGDLATAEKATAIAEAAGISLLVHENFRFQPWYGEIRRQLEGGLLGQVYQATFRLRPGDGQGEDAYLARQPYFRNMPRFVIHETGVHYVDVFRYLFGEVDSVFAQLRQINPVISGEDAALVLLQMSGGVTAVLDANRNADHPASNRRRTLGEMQIEGERGVLRLTGDGQLLLRRHGDNAETPLDYVWQDEDFGGDCVYLTQRAAVAALLGRAPAVNTARDYLVNLRIEEAIYASNTEGRRLALG